MSHTHHKPEPNTGPTAAPQGVMPPVPRPHYCQGTVQPSAGFVRRQVLLSEGCPARWRLLQDRLESVCPTETSTLPLWRRGPRGPGGRNPYFLLEVSAPDCVGILHGKCSPCEPSSTLGEVISMAIQIRRAKDPASCWGV